MSELKRNQVEWALWAAFTGRRPNSGEPPQIFRTRIKRLLDLDRAPMQPSETVRLQRRAFSDQQFEGHGHDISYSELDTLCLSIGLDMLDTGFKQAEVVYSLQHLRLALEKQYERIQKYPPAPRQMIPAEDYPGCPTRTLENGIILADPRIFMVISKVEIREIWTGKEAAESFVFDPVFCHGLVSLSEEMNRLNFNWRKGLVIEIAEIAIVLREHLASAPLVRRGPK